MNDDEMIKILSETQEILKEILKWQKFQGIQILQRLMPNLLDDEKKKTVFEMTDGIITSREICKKTGTALGTISKWWQEWLANGILTKDGKKYIKIISLKDLDTKTIPPRTK